MFSSSFKKKKKKKSTLVDVWILSILQSTELYSYLLYALIALDPLLWGAKQEIVLEEKSIYIGA